MVALGVLTVRVLRPGVDRGARGSIRLIRCYLRCHSFTSKSSKFISTAQACRTLDRWSSARPDFVAGAVNHDFLHVVRFQKSEEVVGESCVLSWRCLWKGFSCETPGEGRAI